MKLTHRCSDVSSAAFTKHCTVHMSALVCSCLLLISKSAFIKLFCFPPSGVGSLLARFQLSDGPSKAAPLAVQFTSEGSTLSGCDIDLAGPGYRFSLVKKRFAAGQFDMSYKYSCHNLFYIIH